MAAVATVTKHSTTQNTQTEMALAGRCAVPEVSSAVVFGAAKRRSDMLSAIKLFALPATFTEEERSLCVLQSFS
jgi:hypothetical protein